MPKISVILTSYNHEKFIREAIDSVLNQTYTDFELIIWDDASIDNSWEIINSYSDSRIKAFCNDEQKRGAWGINKTITEVATGEYIAIHHSDDVWELDKLEKQVIFLDRHPEIGAAFTWAQIIDEHGVALKENWFDQENKTQWQWLNQLFNEKNHLNHPSVLIRKQCYHEVGLYRHGLAQTTDAEMWSRLLIKYPIHVIPEKLTKHRRFSDKSNTSGDRIDVAIRASNEWNVLRENYLTVNSFGDIVAIFPKLERYKTKKGSDAQFLLAMACLYESEQRSAWQLGLTWLLVLIKDEARYKQLNNLYSFSYIDFVRLTAEFDVYSIGQDRQLVELNGVTAAQSQRIVDQDRQLVELNVKINAIYASNSWRLTQPLRSFVVFIHDTILLLKNLGNRINFVSMLRNYKDVISKKPKLISKPSEQSYPVSTLYNIDVLSLGLNHKTLLVVHQFSRTGAPHAVLYLARALFSIYGIRPVVISPKDGPIREEFEKEGFPTVVDPLLFCYQDYSSEACDFVASFERVIVTSLASFGFVRYFRDVAKRQTWWIHETNAGFTSVASMAADLPILFAACESIWLGSTLCFPFALQYTSKDKLHLLLYGCEDTAFLCKPNKSEKVIFSIIGSVEPRKGQDIFLSAIELLPLALRRKAIFRIIGSPLPFEASETFSKKIFADARVISEVECVPNVPLEELQKYYSETDVVISASRDDPMPIVITQGLMYSKICVCSSAIGHASLLENEKDGLIFSNESARELSEKMAWIIRNPDKSKSLGEAGRIKYEKYFHMTSFVDNVGKLLIEKIDLRMLYRFKI